MPKEIDIIEIRKASQENNFVSLADMYPKLVAEWDFEKNNKLINKRDGNVLTPYAVSPGSHQKVFWKCGHGHQWASRISNRTYLGQGCPICSGQSILAGYNDLATINPILASEWHPTKNMPLTPDLVGAGSTKKVWWLSNTCGHEWIAEIRSRHQGANCPYCTGKQILIGFNDLATTHPEIAAQWNKERNGSLKPTDFTAGSGRKVYWICNKGHQWSASIVKRTNGRQCPICSNKKVLAGFNDLQTIQPQLAAEWNYIKNGSLKPTDVTCGTAKKVWWICNKGHQYKASINHRYSLNNGCPICNDSKGELAIRQFLINKNILFKEQYIFSDRRSSLGGALRDDFAIIHNDKVVGTIEYHGKQHYEVVDFSGHNPEKARKNFNDTKIRDADKTRYLQEHNISQLIIPYWEYNNVEKILIGFLRNLNLAND